MLNRRSEDSGAVAIIVAILALVLFGFGALAVDISNMLSRKRMAQSSADFAALAGAQDLPAASAAIDTAYTYLATHDFVPEGTFTKQQLTDTNLANGEIRVISGNRKIVVDLPPRKVSFGLAGALGFSSGDVSAHAVAALRSPTDVLPFFLPTQCSLGPQVLKEGAQSSGPVTEPAPVFSPSSSGTGQSPDVDAISPATSPQGTAIPSLLISGSKFETSGMRADFTRGTSRFDVPATLVGSLPSNRQGTVTVSVPAGVTDTAGTWYVRVRTNEGWSGDSGALPLTISAAEPPPPSGCGQKETGDFGLLDSPRKFPVDNGNLKQLKANIALGLDHGVVPFTGTFPPDTQPRNCQINGSTPIPGGIWDRDPYRDDANCLEINNGNKVDAATDGLILGGGDYNGRLTRSAGKNCPAPSGGTNPATVLNRTINNDTIQCYLKSGYTVSQLVSSSPPNDILDPAIFDSPRFFYVPVINFEFNPPNGWYPIREFRGVFITDETPANSATPSNGLKVNNGEQKLTEIQVLAFKLSALPQSAAGNGNGGVWVGGTRAVRLVE